MKEKYIRVELFMDFLDRNARDDLLTPADIGIALEMIPAEDVQPVVHAHWDVIDGDSGGDETFLHVWETLRCSRCGMERTTEDGYMPQYCESCGAKMDEEAGNDTGTER